MVEGFFDPSPVHVFWERANKKARDRFTVLSKVYNHKPLYGHVTGFGSIIRYVSFPSRDGYPFINLFEDGGVSYGRIHDDFKFMLLRTWLDLEPV